MATAGSILTIVAIAVGTLWLLFRRWERHLVAGANVRLQLPISSFQLQSKRQLIDRILSDPQLQERIAAQAECTGRGVPELQSTCRRYAREIVPNFKATFYFRFGYWIARSLLMSLYRVHVRVTDTDAMDAIRPGASVILVSNHRSNMDVLLLNYLVSRRSTLMHTAGEWARMWPLYYFVRLAGNCVTDRDAADDLYRAVFKVCVQMAVREQTSIGIFPEGELPRDGRMSPPKFGLFSYAVTANPPFSGRDYVVPVGINYDQAAEEKQLIATRDVAYRHRGQWRAIAGVARAIIVFTGRLLSPRRAQFGNACVCFGRPVLISDWQEQEGVNHSDNPREWVSRLGDQTMQQIANLVPVLPTHVLATTLLASPDARWSRDALLKEALQCLDAFRGVGAIVCMPDDDDARAIGGIVDDFVRRKLITIDAGNQIITRRDQLQLLRYTANSVCHLAGRF